MLKEIITAISAYFQAHRFIIKHRLWKWILIPGLIYSLLFCVGIYLFWKSSNYAIDFMLVKSGVKEWIVRMQNSWLSWLVIFAQIMLHLVLMLFYFSLFKYLFLIVGSPLFAYLSEKTEAIIEGTDFPFSFTQLLKDIVRGIRIALRNMLWQTVYAVSIFILAFFPVIGWITPLIALMVEFYYFGFSMLDYSSERHKLSTSQSIAFIGKHKGLAIGNGMVFYLCIYYRY
ncbi:MAG: EI24 domain-containing protein [Ferruginibacter sp.]